MSSLTVNSTIVGVVAIPNATIQDDLIVVIDTINEDLVDQNILTQPIGTANRR